MPESGRQALPNAVVAELRWFRRRCRQLSDSGLAARAVRRQTLRLEEQVLDKLPQLQRAGADLDYVDGLGSALIEAVHMQSKIFAVTLLSLGARPEVTDDSGMSPLFCATAMGDYDMMATLLAHGAAPGQRDPQRCTPLEHAVQARDPHAAQVLLAHGASLEDADLADKSFAEDVFRQGVAGPWLAGRARLPIQYFRLLRPWLLLSLRRATVHLTLKPWLGSCANAQDLQHPPPAGDACYLLVFSLPKELVSRLFGFLVGRDVRFGSLHTLRDSFENIWRNELQKSRSRSWSRSRSRSGSREAVPNSALPW